MPFVSKATGQALAKIAARCMVGQRLSDQKQPGGWVYNILPFVEQEPLYKLAGPDGSAQRIQTPLAIFNCPSRRANRAYNNGSGFTYAETTNTVPLLARTDYAANCGSQAVNEFFGGPISLAAGDSPGFPWHNTDGLNGVCFERSMVRFADVTNGTSNTYMVGEKYLNPDHYDNGWDPADNENMYTGFNNDVFRCAAFPPLQDRKGLTNTFAFGSMHPSGTQMAFCDGSVRFVEYQIPLDVHMRQADRR